MATSVEGIQEEEISRMEEGVNTKNRGSDYHLGFSSKDIVTILQKVNIYYYNIFSTIHIKLTLD